MGLPTRFWLMRSMRAVSYWSSNLSGSKWPAFWLTMRSEERRVGKECRSLCDWSSDVCSSDLDGFADALLVDEIDEGGFVLVLELVRLEVARLLVDDEIGRASCRERV